MQVFWQKFLIDFAFILHKYLANNSKITIFAVSN